MYGTERSRANFLAIRKEGWNVDTDVGQLLESLPLAQRLLRYRQLSQEALRKATDTADKDIRAGYLSMAAGWHMLATEIERVTNREGVGDTRDEACDEFAPGEKPAQNRDRFLPS